MLSPRSAAFVAALVSLCVAQSVSGAQRRARAYPKVVKGPAIVFTETTVAARGLPPGATAYFSAVSITNANGLLAVERGSGTAVADASGVAVFTPNAPVRLRSVWLVVGHEGYTVAAPEGMLLREREFPGDSLMAGGNGLLLSQSLADVTLVRRGSGIWSAALRDGQERRGIAVDLGTLTGSTAPPQKIEPGDVLFVVDPLSLEFAVTVRGK